jgi:hypothetical protein
MHTLSKIVLGFSCLTMVSTLQAENISSYSATTPHVSRLQYSGHFSSIIDF